MPIPDDQLTFEYSLRSTVPLTLFKGAGQSADIMAAGQCDARHGRDRILPLARTQLRVIQEVSSGAAPGAIARQHVTIELLNIHDPAPALTVDDVAQIIQDVMDRRAGIDQQREPGGREREAAAAVLTHINNARPSSREV